MNWILTIFIAAAAAADYAVCRRHLAGRWVLWLLWIADCVPLAMQLAVYLAGDNTQPWCDASMRVMLAWMLTVVPKTIIFAALSASRSRWVHAAGAAAAAAVVVALVCGAVWGRKDLIVNEVEIRSARLPESFDGFRAAIFSDLHIGSLPDGEEYIGRVVDAINSTAADAVFFCGDLVNIRHTELDPARMALLGSIRSRCGTFSVTGNHDTGHYVADTIALPADENRRLLLGKERSMGWQPLEGRSVYIRRGGDSISVTGIPFFDSLREIRHSRRIPQMEIAGAYEGIDSATFNITLAHIPQMWPQIRALGRGDVTLSGHVHAMQLKLTLFGLRMSPARLQYRHWSGLYDDGCGGSLYVNDGTGTVGIPVRIGARPEITVITLRR